MFFNSIHAAYQRVTRGFCYWDVWDFDTHLAELMAQGLTVLADEGCAYPGNDEFPTPESWSDYLHEIVRLLRFSLDEQPNEYQEEWMKKFDTKKFLALDAELDKKFLDKERENAEKQQAALQRALEMIVHVWGDLWD